jgi:hypothetical protein
MPTLDLFRGAWKVTASGYLLWAAVFLYHVVPSFPRTPDMWMLNCLLSPFGLAFGIIAPSAIPYLVARARQGTRSTLRETLRAVASFFPRVLRLLLALAIPTVVLLSCAYFRFYPPYGRTPSISTVLLVQFALIPVLNVVVSLAFAGVIIDNVGALRAVANSVLISTNNPLSVLCILLLSLIGDLVAVAVLFLEGGSPSAISQLILFAPALPAHSSAWVYTLWHVLRALATLPFATYASVLIVLVYQAATRRIQYPGIPSGQAA